MVITRNWESAVVGQVGSQGDSDLIKFSTSNFGSVRFVSELVSRFGSILSSRFFFGGGSRSDFFELDGNFLVGLPCLHRLRRNLHCRFPRDPYCPSSSSLALHPLALLSLALHPLALLSLLPPVNPTDRDCLESWCN